MAMISSACPTATNTGSSRTTMNAGYSSPQWAGRFEAWDTAKSSAGSAKSARCWCRWKHIGCECGLAAAWWIGGWRHSPRYPCPQRLSPWRPSPWGAPRWLCRRGVNQSLGCRRGYGSCVCVRGGYLSCSFPLFEFIHLRHCLLHASQGFCIAQGSFYS